MGQAVPAARDTRLKREKDKTFFCSEVGCADGSDGKDSICNARRPEFDPWVGKIPWKRASQYTPVFLPGESKGQRSRAEYRPWGCKESDMTE